MNKRRDLLRALPAGYSIGFPVASGDEGNARSRKVGGHGSHPYVLKPDGTPLRGTNGVPIKVASSPGSQRTWKYELVRIRRALRALETT